MPKELTIYSLTLLQMRMELRNTLTPFLKEHGLSLETWLILECLMQENDGVTLSQLAHRIQGLHLSAVSKYVDRLQKFALLYRHHDVVDRRSVVIMISANGKELLKKIEQSFSNAKDELEKSIPVKTRKGLINIHS
jgi:DNA-binding MarR family transcriptional regulator